MKFPVPKTLTGAVLPMLLISWIFGIGVIGYPISRPRRIISAFWSVVNLLIFLGFMKMTNYSQIAKSRESIIEDTNYLVNTILCTSFAAISMYLAQMRAKVVEDTFLNLNGISNRLKILGIPDDYDLHLKSQIIQLGVAFASISISMALDLGYISADSPSQSSGIGFLLSDYYFLFFISVVNYTFSGSMRYFHNRFQRLNTLLLELGSLDTTKTTVPHQSDNQFPRCTLVIREIHGNNSHSIRTAKKQWILYVIEETRKIHRDLCKTATKLNRAFGMQVLVSVALTFNVITGFLYKVYTTATASSLNVSTDNFWLVILITIIWITVYAMGVILIIDTCEDTSGEANRTGGIIGKLLDTAAQNEAIRDKMSIFSLQLLQNPLKFTAIGFFPLNYSLIHGIIGSVTTYLIIMIQMQNIY